MSRLATELAEVSLAIKVCGAYAAVRLVQIFLENAPSLGSHLRSLFGRR